MPAQIQMKVELRCRHVGDIPVQAQAGIVDQDIGAAVPLDV
jgi:hypothetical protein